MSAVNRSGVPDKTSQTDQYVLNYSFDEQYKMLMVGMAAFNPKTLTYDRVQIDDTGALTTAGASSSSAVYTSRLSDTGVYTYVGEAVPGSSEGAAVWRIQRIADSDVTTVFADGNANFDNVWTDRESLSYS